ncbi:MAG: hypothetical protein R6V06_06465 [Kiritimatiellia bacterium]
MKIKIYFLTLLFYVFVSPAVTFGNAAEEKLTVAASDSYNGEGFTYTRSLKEKVRNHVIYSVTYPSPVKSALPQNNIVPAELFIPVGLKPDSGVPAVIVMHILKGDFALSRMMCSRLSEAGIAAMFFKQPYYGSRGGKLGRRALIQSFDSLMTGFRQSTADARRAFDIIRDQEGVDPEKCGVTGISLGAIRAGALCAHETRIKRAYLSLVAGDLKKVILSARETRDLKVFIQNLSADQQDQIWECVKQQDPLTAVPQLKKMAEAGRLRMVRAEKDQIMPPECSIRLFDAVGHPESMICLKGMGHYSAMAGLSGVMDDLTSFFAEDMPADWKPSAVRNNLTPVVLLGVFIRDLSELIAAEPKDGCAHMVGMKLEFDVKGKKFKADFDLALGNNGCFKLSGVFPEVGRAGLGRGSFPWITGGGKKVFCGTELFDENLKLVDLTDSESMLYYRMAAGLAAGAALSPELINNYAEATVKNRDGNKVLHLVSVKKEQKGSADIVFDSSGRFPQRLVWDLEDSSGKIEFSHWQINAASHSSLFDPDENLVRQKVRQKDVMQMFASAFQFVTDVCHDL